jgi:DNA-binding transcriptional LysR family regulator
MWELIEFREIRVFLVLAEELHFGRTAARLGLTQSRVSQSLRALERKLGVELFDRTSRRVVLTAAGGRVREAVRQPYDALTGALRVTYETHHPAPVRLGTNNAASVGPRLLRVIDVYEGGAPGRALQIVELQAADMLGALRRGEVDVIIARLPAEDPDLVVGPIIDHEPRVLAVAHDHPLAHRAGVSLEDIADYDVAWTDGVFPTADEAFFPSRTPDGRPIRLKRLGINDISELIVTIARGNVVHPTISSFATHHGHPGVRYVPIVDLSPAPAALIWCRQPLTAALQEFIRVAKDTAPGAAGPSATTSGRSRG